MNVTNTAKSKGSDGRLELRLPHGAVFPNWSAVESDTVRNALGAIFVAFEVEKCWIDMGESEDRVRRAILEHCVEKGHAPSYADLVDVTGLAPDDVRDLVRSLRDRDLVVLDGDAETLAGAYPFTERDTGHRVNLGDVRLNAMCAIDALGAPAMCGKDAMIDSVCRECGAAIRVTTREKGDALDEVSPASAVVWSGIRYEDNCAADSLCTVIAFFCSDAHLEAWRTASRPDTKGFRLSMDEAMQAGKAIFMPMLSGAVSNE